MAVHTPARRASAPLLVGLVVLCAACGIATGTPAPPAPTRTAPVITPVPTPVLTEPVPTPEPTFLIYQVGPNDALSSIAKRFRTTVDSIGYWNRERYATLDPDSAAYAPDSIKVGWLLRIHPGLTTDGDFGAPSETPAETASPGASPRASPSPTG
jgi:hypothetical protein